MTTPRIINTQIRAGIWSGDLLGAGATEPQIGITHQNIPLEDVTCTHDTSRDLWRVAVPIPVQMINDGLHTFAVTDASGQVIAHFTLMAGEALAGDLRAEIDLLRSELDILKSAFRKHCAAG